MLELNKMTKEDIDFDINRAKTHLSSWIERFQDPDTLSEKRKKSILK